MLERIPRQHETDLAFLRRLAERNGYVFYVEPVDVRRQHGVLGPGDPRSALPQPALTMNMGARDERRRR